MRRKKKEDLLLLKQGMAFTTFDQTNTYIQTREYLWKSQDVLVRYFCTPSSISFRGFGIRFPENSLSCIESGDVLRRGNGSTGEPDTSWSNCL